MSVTPVAGFAVPAVAVRSTVAPATGAPDLSDTTIWIVVDPPEVTDLVNGEIDTLRAPRAGCRRLPKDHTLFTPPNVSTQPENESRSYTSRFS